MKNLVKKLTLAICALSASVMLTTAPALASSEGEFRTGPGGTSTVADTATTTDDSSSGVAASAADTASAETVSNTASANDVTSQTAEKTTNKRYLTRLGGFFWFLLSVIVNFILSCWVGNKFYKMARRSAQGSSEIRALRKDIEEKFASTLKDINEPAVEVINRNENYARGEGIEMPERKSRVELDEEELEMMRRWDSKRTAEKALRANREEDDFEEEPRKSAKRSYQPTRRSSGIEFDEEEYDEDSQEEERRERRRPARRPKSNEAISNAKNKAKDFLSNVFPFDE